MRSRLPYLLFSLLVLCCFALGAAPASAVQYNVRLRVTRSTVLSNGKDKTLVIAEVIDPSGRQVTANIDVQFQTTLGAPSSNHASTFGSSAQIEWSSAIAGLGRITALVAGSVSNTVEVLFTDDPEATFQGNNYVQISGNRYLVYSVTDQVIETIGRKPSAKITFRNTEITADHLQINCKDMVVRGQDNVSIRRGKALIHVNRLYYSLNTGEGYAITEKDGQLRTVSISGMGLLIESFGAVLPNTFMKMAPLQVKLNVTAKTMTYFPGDKLQFQHAKFYQDQTLLISLPYYEMSLTAPELFSDQFIKVGTSGLGLELPYYYNISPHGMGIVLLRHQQQIGRSSFSQDNGWGVDVAQSYTSAGQKHFDGAYGFTGLTRSDWGFRWTHNSEFSNTTQGAFYVDFPQHNSVFSSANLTQNLKTFRWQTTLSAGQTFGSNENNFRSNVYVETQPHRLDKNGGLNYTFGVNYIGGTIHSTDPTVGSLNETTQSATLRISTRPRLLDKRTTFSNSFTAGHIWSNQGRNGLETLASFSLDRTLSGGSSLNLAYDYVNQPGGLLVASGNHRVGLTYSATAGKRFTMLVYGSGYLDTSDASLLTDITYRLNTNWRLIASATFQKYQSQSYNDMEFTIGRRIGARELQFTYSTLFQRVSLDLTATRF